MARTQITTTTEDGVALLHVPHEHLIRRLTISGAPYLVLYNTWIGSIQYSETDPHVFPTIFLRTTAGGYNDLYVITTPNTKLTVSWIQTFIPEDERTSAMQNACNVFKSKL